MAQIVIDLVNNFTAAGLVPQTLTTTAQGGAIDGSNAEASLNMIVDVSVPTAANVTSLVVQAEECATTNGTFTVIPGMVVTVTATTAAANIHQVVRGLRTQRYFRANANTFAATTTTGAFPTCVQFVSQSRFQPATATGADTYPA